jgi:hypothetical protein
LKAVLFSFFLIGEFLQTFIRPEKCDFDQYKGFIMEKMVQIRQIFERKKNSKSSDFRNKFQ